MNTDFSSALTAASKANAEVVLAVWALAKSPVDDQARDTLRLAVAEKREAFKKARDDLALVATILLA